MRARELIRGSVFDAGELAIVSRAFDLAWAEVAPQYVGREEQARVDLAKAILEASKSHPRDGVIIRSVALYNFRRQSRA